MNVAKINVNVWDYNENLIEVPMFRLLQWRAALKLEAQGMKHSRRSVTAQVRTKLSVPDSDKTWDAAALAKYIGDTINNVKAQLPSIAESLEVSDG
jgi:hypothetical protein